MSSYEGRGSLRTWLGTIIRHRAVNQSELKALEGLPLEALRHKACDRAAGEFDAERFFKLRAAAPEANRAIQVSVQ